MKLAWRASAMGLAVLAAGFVASEAWKERGNSRREVSPRPVSRDQTQVEVDASIDAESSDKADAPSADEGNGEETRQATPVGIKPPVSTSNAVGEKGQLTVTVKGVSRGKGPVRVALFDSDRGFPDQKFAMRTQDIAAEGETVEFTFSDLKCDTVAVGVYQDLDENSQLTRGAFSIPKEPYGFSRNARGTFGPPAFTEAEVRLSGRDCSAEVKIR